MSSISTYFKKVLGCDKRTCLLVVVHKGMYLLLMLVNLIFFL